MEDMSPQQQEFHVGQLLKSKRLALGLTMREVALKLGVPLAFVGKVECGDRTLSDDELQEYNKVLTLSTHTGIANSQQVRLH